MKLKGITGRIPSKFKSIQSSIFCAVSVLVLSAVLVVTLVSLRYTNSSIYENSVMYTQTIIKQLNQNIDSYISYMDNIASLIAGSGDAYKYLYSSNGRGAIENENYSEYRHRLVEQFKTILKGRPISGISGSSEKIRTVRCCLIMDYQSAIPIWIWRLSHGIGMQWGNLTNII